MLEDREPDLHTYRMLRDQHGAFEPLADALGTLRHLGLIKIERAGAVSDEYVRRRDYYLLAAGESQAEKLRSQIPELAWYDQQTGLVGLVTQGMTGGQLKAMEYGHEEYANAPVGQLIGGIAHRVGPRLAAALKREGLA